jgi:hypothetical protein
MLISEAIEQLEVLKAQRGDLPVYMQFNDGMYISIDKIFPDIVVNPEAVKGEGKLAELVVLSNDDN